MEKKTKDRGKYDSKLKIDKSFLETITLIGKKAKEKSAVKKATK